MAAGAYGAGVFDSLSQGGFDDPASESARELARERELFGNRSVDVVAVYSAPDGSGLAADDPAFRAEVERVVDEVPEGTVAQVVTAYDVPDGSLVSDDGRAVQVLVSLAGESQDDFLRAYDELAPALESDLLRTDLAGAFAVYSDVNEITAEDLERAELLSLPLVLLLALLIFRSLVAALMPVLVGLVALLGALAVVRLVAQVTEVSVFSVNVVSLLGIGLAIDYALFVVSRFREELATLRGDAGGRAPGPDAVAEAVHRTMASAGRTVLFSGLTVAAAMSSLLVFPQAFLRSMAYGGAAAVLVAMLAALTVLPAALRLLGHRVDAGRLPALTRRGRGGRRGAEAGSPATDEGARWAALARAVMRRPVVVVTVTVAVLLAVASPFLGAQWGSVDHRVLPADAPAHVAADLVAAEFGGETSSASLLLEGASEAEVAAYVEAVQRVDGVVAVTPVAQEAAAVLLRATWEGDSQSERAQGIVADLRDVDPAGGEVLVGGIAADTVDLLDSVADRLPWMGLIVVVVMLVLLFVAFGSVVLPVKAVVMNLVSITASFGVVTWIFGDGNGADLLGFEPQGFLDATNPILMLAILFGLSMDYEVFLLSRVREQWDRSAGDPTLTPAQRNRLAVVTGVQKTGRIITSAALLLAIVIGAFATSGIVFMKMLGVGMLVALLLDATVVRALLVPATMALLGRWNWWAPGPLARWWERHGFREEGRAPGRATGPATGPATGGDDPTGTPERVDALV
nr:MMPL family transporter [Nocardioides perillae]